MFNLNQWDRPAPGHVSQFEDEMNVQTISSPKPNVTFCSKSGPKPKVNFVQNPVLSPR